jgi:hypothetical protein
MIQPGDFVQLHLANPTEKFWGVLEGLDPTGVVIKGLSLASFDDWVTQVARSEPPSLGLSTQFVPLLRVERMFLDEQVGEVESYCQRFAARVGVSVESHLGLGGGDDEVPS